MSKKTNTLWFLLGATIFNIIVTMTSFLLYLVLYSKVLIPAIKGSTGAVTVGLVVVFLLALATGFFVYHFALKALLKKIDVDKYFDPLFMPRGARKNRLN